VTGRSVGVVVVGTGFVAGQHLRALASNEAAALAGVVDADAGRAEAAARAHGGVRWTTDLAAALAWPGVDAAIVCTPNLTADLLYAFADPRVSLR